MLADPKFVGPGADMVQVLAVLGEGLGRMQQLGRGFYRIPHFSMDLLLWNQNAPKWEMGYPENLPGGLNCYGVCDTAKQFMERYASQLDADPRRLVVSLTHIAKDPANRGRGGGWRWHKWGPYVGDGRPTREYLDDEEDFDDGVYVYHVYCLDREGEADGQETAQAK